MPGLITAGSDSVSGDGPLKEPKIDPLKQHRVVGIIGLLLSIICVPLIFERGFAISPLSESTRAALWCFFVFLSALSCGIIAKPRAIPEPLILFFFGCLVLVSAEFSARLFINLAQPQLKKEIAKHVLQTFPENLAFVGHPFLQFTGRPSTAPEGQKPLEIASRYNNFGFSGKDFHFEKAERSIRTVTLGESTTDDGYPAIMEKILNNSNLAGDYSFEVLNFGMGSYTTAHAVVNFFLNVIDFSPDYIVIHHNWNEGKMRKLKKGFRNDYSHVLDSFHEPLIVDKYFIRGSVLYCLVKEKFFSPPHWWFLDMAIQKKGLWLFSSVPDDDSHLYPYERNLRTIIDFSILRNIRVVLTTQPHSLQPNIRFGSHIPHMTQCNKILRKLGRDYGDKIVFVDLDKLMTGKMEPVFIDVGHMKSDGIQFKARVIGEAILSDFKNRTKPSPEKTAVPS